MKINSGAVLSSLPNAAHVLAVDSGGGLRRLPVSTLKSGIRADLGVSMSRNITVAGEQWVRVAKNTHHDLPFCGVLTLTHSWSSGMPVPLVCVVNGASGKAAAMGACRLTSGTFYGHNAANNTGASFLKVRFVDEADAIYVEAQFKPGSNAPTIASSLCGQINMSLTEATVSMATADKVLKTIDLYSGGVMRCITVGYDSLCAPRQKGGHHERGYEDESDWLGLLFGKPLFVSDIHRGISFKSPLLSVCKAKRSNRRDNRPRRVCDAWSVSILLYSGESAVQHGGKSDVSMEPQRGICLSVDNCHDVGERVGILLQVKKSPRMESMEVNPRHHGGFILNCRKEVAYV